MVQHLIYLINVAVFSLILVIVVPRKDIRRLSIYGIIFGTLMDIIALLIGKATGLFGFINYGPFGFKGISIFASGAWAIYFILYFYFLPENKLLISIYALTGIIFSVLYTNMVIELGIFSTVSRILLPLIVFSIWFTVATWGYLKLNSCDKENKS